MNTIRILDVVLRAAPHAPFAGSGTGLVRFALSLALMGPWRNGGQASGIGRSCLKSGGGDLSRSR